MALFLIPSALLGGCGAQDGPDLSPVEGTVTMDGKPVPEALVTFQPHGRQGTYSFAYTDNNGKYRLVYSRSREGAMTGEHQVTISTLKDSEDRHGRPIRSPETIPPRYNTETELLREVVAGRTNTIDFDLESRGFPPAARVKSR